MTEEDLIASYRSALEAYLRSGTMPALAQSRVLGNQAVGAGISYRAILSVHDAATLAFPDDPEVRRANAFLAYFLEPALEAERALRISHLALLERQRGSEQIPEVLLEGVPTVIYIAAQYGKEQEVLYVGPQIERLLGFRPVDWLARPGLWQDRLHPLDRERVLAEERLAIVQGWPFTAEYRLLARDGREVWVHDEVGPVRDSAGEPRYWRGMLLDITERREAQQRAAVDRDGHAYRLYDSTVHSLQSAALLTQAIRKLWQTEPGRAERKLAELTDLVQQALVEMQTLPLEMQPEGLAEMTLDQLLTQYLEAFQGRTKTSLDLVTGPLPTLPSEVKIAFYRVAQEVLNRIARPTRARHVAVRLEMVDDHLRMTLTADGSGDRPEAMLRGRFGLRFLRERAGAIGARLEVRGTPGQQMEIRLTWPAAQFRA